MCGRDGIHRVKDQHGAAAAGDAQGNPLRRLAANLCDDVRPVRMFAPSCQPTTRLDAYRVMAKPF